MEAAERLCPRGLCFGFLLVPLLLHSHALTPMPPHPTPARRRRSQRILRRSSSLGDESHHNHMALATGGEEVSSATDSTKRPLFSIGILADIQYAPVPDGYSYSGVPRYYRHALTAARVAASHFQKEQVDLVVNLGDIVDGKCQNPEEHGGEAPPAAVDPGHSAVDEVLEALGVYQHGPVLHAYGNHCLYNLDRPTLSEKLNIPFVKEPCGDLVGYFCHRHKSWAFVTLDSYDIGLLQRCARTSIKRKQAEAILKNNNPNFHENINSPEGLGGMQQRFVGFNGGVGPVQLAWLERVLEEARERQERCIILSHQPILPGTSSPVCLMWNYKEVLQVLRRYRDVVAASFAGHAHKGGYRRDAVSGIHFRVFEAVLESPDPIHTYAMIDVHEDRLQVRGHGKCQSACYELDHTVILGERVSAAAP